jgi:ribonuclease HII
MNKNFFEKKAWKENLFVCGIDEVGRGCLAGPLVVSAVILPLNTKYTLKDSKIITHEKREIAFRWLVKNSFYSIAFANNYIIDKINIYQATLFCMRKAVYNLIESLPFSVTQLKYILVDALPLTLEHTYLHKDIEIHNFPHGESLSRSIAAASIVAKVFRDSLMNTISKITPTFKFEHHKGYGTKDHLDTLSVQGPSILHRKSFIGQLSQESHNNEQQKNIF